MCNFCDRIYYIRMAKIIDGGYVHSKKYYEEAAIALFPEDGKVCDEALKNNNLTSIKGERNGTTEL